MPAATVLDLTTAGAEASANGALVRQSAALPTQGDQFDTFLRLRNQGTEAGYNTNHRPLRMDQKGGRAVTHALNLADVPTVVVDGVAYREFVLDVRQQARHPFISLRELRLYTSDNPRLHGYNGDDHTLGGRSAVFDLDAGGNVTVRLNANLNAGAAKGDAVVLVPADLFGDDKYVFLFSRFSGANGQAEEWGVRHSTPAGETGSLGGSVFVDMNANGTREPEGTTQDPVPEPTLAGVSIVLTYTNAAGETVTQTTTTDANGNYVFTGLAAGTYYVVVVPPEGYRPGPANEYTVTVTAGGRLPGFDFGVLPDEEAN